ncbi:non-specific lipid-transfer protein 4.1-like [Prosopis cineraria]|uniref:non-specific lipid-transfer protein 4.1-like n=1 Tax=Prosopis cineraria TaxID=364024 RepID=UPI00240FCD70|nr:non-specific lipid-transfer protein 4.1-like [Prosopis cineraria]
MNPSHFVPSLLVLLVLLAASSSSDGAITCDQAVGYLKPCNEYLTGPTGAKPPPACCDGAKALVAAASTPEDRKAACECAKAAAKTINVNLQNAHDLPDNCGISLPFEISPDLDCNKIGYGTIVEGNMK